MKFLPRLAIYLLITVLVGGFFTVNASASSLPGDALYGLKLSWEQTRLMFAFDDDYRSELEFEFVQERISELETLLATGQQAEVEFYGTLEEKGDSAWLISGITVQIGPETEIKGSPEVGTTVKVEALTQEDGSMLALEIESELPDSDDDMEDEDEFEIEDESDDDMDDDDDDDMDDDDDDDMYDDDDDDMYDDDDDDMNDDDDDDMNDDDDDEEDDEDEEEDDDDEDDESEDDEEDESDDDEEDESDDD